jgi:biotin-(acetyl-CoA carboxylase) ligase
VLTDLPPVYGPVIALREAGDALARAVALAPAKGAGTLVWVRSYSRVEAAVVLEPDLPLAEARLALLAAANALADALAVLGPPEIPIGLRWPATLLVNGAEVGALRLAWPEGAREDAPPDWMVVAVEARVAFPEGREPGTDPGRTSLLEEGFAETSPAEIVAGWARHLMAVVAEWQDKGVRAVAEPFLARLDPETAPPRARRGLDPATGDLVLDMDGVRTRRALREALEAAAT